MATVTVQNTVTDPSGNVLANIPVSVQLINGSLAPGYTTASSIISSDTTVTNVSGTWSMALTPNSAITPANTYYRIIEGNGYTSSIVVPPSGGPYNLSALVVVPPTPSAVGITGVQVANNGTVIGSRPEINLIPSTNIGLTVADNPTNGRVDVTLTASGGIPPSVVTTKGDLIAATANATVTRQPAGVDGQVLVADSTQATGLRYAYTTPVVFDVRTYGAKGDGVTNDTVAIQNAIDAAVTYAQANSGYGQVVIPPAGQYLISSPLRTDRSGNAQLAFPVIATTVNKPTIAITGGETAASMPHWQQLTPQLSGAVLKSTVNSADFSGTNNEGSLLGGPTPANGYGRTSTYSNMNVVIRGVQFQVPETVRGADTWGVDLRGVANAEVRNVAVYTNSYPAKPITAGGVGWACGIGFPTPGNNDLVIADNISVEGFPYGIYLGEHVQGGRLAVIYCYVGVLAGDFWGSVGQQHVSSVHNISCEVSTIGLWTINSCKIVVEAFSAEGSMTHVQASSTATGYVGLGGIISAITVTDPCNVKVVNLNQAIGAVTAPGVPATTVALRNPFWRDAIVAINGGTVTVIAVDGVTQFTSTGRTVIVPSGKSITLTYSVAPTWTWTLL